MSAALASSPAAPAACAPATDVAVYEIHAGRMRAGTVRSRLPACVARSWFEPGPLMPHAAAVLAEVRSVLDRCAPWLRVYLGPRLWSACGTADADAYACRAVVRHLPGGRTEYEHRGLACWGDGVLLVAASATLPDVLSVLHHEVWHGVERHLPEAAVAVVTAAVAAGRPRPGEYLTSGVERRARLYESWASAVDEGHQLVLSAATGSPVAPLDQVFLDVYSGALARRVLAPLPAPRRGWLARVWGWLNG